jgi:hypothetical protein
MEAAFCITVFSLPGGQVDRYSTEYSYRNHRNERMTPLSYLDALLPANANAALPSNSVVGCLCLWEIVEAAQV